MLFSRAHGMFFSIDHMLDHKTNLNKFNTIIIISSILSSHKRMRFEVNHERKKGRKTERREEAKKRERGSKREKEGGRKEGRKGGRKEGRKAGRKEDGKNANMWHLKNVPETLGTITAVVSTGGFPVLPHLLELVQTQVH